ncbi:hypothetical protein R5R35_009408 [Gryllus longicercus]|uniref:L-2-hydroxyglutarate dehydrogenase, mitochondrial n=1 Tax=Gryllus longicercus TaxID=2509291 RepID=A0AAN9VSI8_9ORTH
MAAFTIVSNLKSRNLMSVCFNLNAKYTTPAVYQNERRIVRDWKNQRHYSTDEDPCLYDVVVVGGGIVGMATARELLNQHPTIKVALLEKEKKLALHQTGHNSGVIHAGIYYKPKSLKATLCVKGLHLMYKYCDSNNIPYKKCGKLIVATDKTECEQLDDLIDRGKKNNVPGMRVLEGHEIKKIEPNCKGVRAIWSPHTGIINYAQVTESMGLEFEDLGGDIHLNFKVTGFRTNKSSNSESERAQYPLEIVGNKKCVKTRYAVVCAGLYSDKLAVMTGCKRSPKIVPIRGEYMLLNDKKVNLVSRNIYPVPNPKYPFLGVHFTPRMDGSVWLGPNAVLAFKREGYRWMDFSIVDFIGTVTYPGFIKLAAKNAKFGMQEMVKSIYFKKQVDDLRKFIPDVTVNDVKRGPAGVRAQALDSKGNLVDDFVFDLNEKTEVGKRVLHCRNAPSPGATSSLAIAELIVQRLNEQFNLCML